MRRLTTHVCPQCCDCKKDIRDGQSYWKADDGKAYCLPCNEEYYDSSYSTKQERNA